MAADPRVHARPLVVATYNIRHGQAASGGVDVALLARTCAALSADVLALQEVDRQTVRCHRADLAGAVGDASGMDHYFAPTMKRFGGEYGNALLVRGVLHEVEVLPLPRLGRREPRNAVLARATVADGDVSLAATHLSVHPPESTVQLQTLAAVFAGWPIPRVLLGDLNLATEVVGPLTAAGLHVVGGGPTFPAERPRRRIDHVALEGFDVVDVQIPVTPVSDHRPLVVSLRRTLPPSGGPRRRGTESAATS